jgi:hypothetical protein
VLQQKTTDFEVADGSSGVQRRVSTVQQNNQHWQATFRFMQRNQKKGRGNLLSVFRLNITVAEKEKTAGFIVAIGSRQMQWSV